VQLSRRNGTGGHHQALTLWAGRIGAGGSDAIVPPTTDTAEL
jgi:hypothetical protein